MFLTITGILAGGNSLDRKTSYNQDETEAFVGYKE